MTENIDPEMRELVESLLDVLDGLEQLGDARERAMAALTPFLRDQGWKPPEEVKHESDS